jgi:hypothetical protein
MQRIDGRSGISPRSTLPDDGDPPSSFAQLLYSDGIALTVAAQLLDPELAVLSGNAEESAAVMGVPEAPVNQDNCIVSADDKVGSAWQTRGVQAETDPAAEQTFPQHKFRLRIPAPDTAHHR